MKRKTIALVLTMLCFGMLISIFHIHPARASLITVPDQYPTIQAAVDVAEVGDTIFVRNGTYTERIIIWTPGVTLIGENKYGTIIDAAQGSEVLWDVTVAVRYTSNVTLTGFTIKNAETLISLTQSINCTIVDNIISDNTLGDPNNWGGGISLQASDNNTIADNILSNITEIGIFHDHSSRNTEVNNVIIQNDSLGLQTTNGVHMDGYSHDNAILNNTISGSLVGIYAGTLAYNNIIAGNTIENLTSYECGINIWGPDNKIMNNTITGMSYVGIQLNSMSSDGGGTPNACAYNIVRGNVISQCTFGINLILAAFSNTIAENNVSTNILGIYLSDSSNSNTIIQNLMSNNDNGLLVFSSNDTRVYHNSFSGNTQQVVLSDSYYTVWNDDYPSGGNYWSDYGGSDSCNGPYQDLPGSDGIGDTPYPIDFDNIDHYPLMNPYVPPNYTLTIIASTGGTTDPAFGTHTYVAGSTVQVAATPDANYILSGWELDAVNVGSANPCAVLMDDNHTLKPSFTYIPPAPLTVSISPVSASIFMGQSVSFTSMSTGGTPPYSYQWYLNDNPVSGANSSSWTLVTQTPGSYSVCLNVTDSLENTTQSETASITVTGVPGDIDVNGAVNMGDVTASLDAFGSYPTHSRWNPMADINGNSKADMEDIIIVLMNFGKHYP